MSFGRSVLSREDRLSLAEWNFEIFSFSAYFSSSFLFKFYVLLLRMAFECLARFKVAFTTLSTGVLALSRNGQKPRKLFGWPINTFLVQKKQKTEKCMRLKLLLWRKHPFTIKNTRIKQLCNRKVRDFAMALLALKRFPGLSRKGPRTDRNSWTMLLLRVWQLGELKANFNYFSFVLMLTLDEFILQL